MTTIQEKKEQFISELAEEFIEDTPLAQKTFTDKANVLFDLYAKEYLNTKLELLEKEIKSNGNRS